MSINWFPGHMATAAREIRKAMPTVDFVIEVLDARLPFSTENPLVDELRGDKPYLKVLSKADLADPEVTSAWLAQLEARPGVRAFAHSKDQTDLPRRLLALGRSMLPPERNASRDVVVMILGIPNVGKSTLINMLAGRNLADTGNKPAVTKRQQSIPIAGKYTLLDTPGFLWPKLSPPDCGYRLAVSGAIGAAAYDFEDVGPFAVRYLRDHYPDALKTRYNLTDLPADETEILHAIAARRGCVRAGGVIDMQKVCEVVIQDFRRGSLGRVSLETPG